MGVRIEKVELPGIGVRHDVVMRSGRRIAVVAHRSGERDIALFRADDPDACIDSIRLDDDESTALANLLGGSVMLEQLLGLRERAAGIFTEQLTIPNDSPYVDRPLGDTKARTRTGASIVAVLRGDEAIASPTPETVLHAADSLIAVGTREGLDALARLIADGSS